MQVEEPGSQSSRHCPKYLRITGDILKQNESQCAGNLTYITFFKAPMTLKKTSKYHLYIIDEETNRGSEKPGKFPKFHSL